MYPEGYILYQTIELYRPVHIGSISGQYERKTLWEKGEDAVYHHFLFFHHIFFKKSLYSVSPNWVLLIEYNKSAVRKGRNAH